MQRMVATPGEMQKSSSQEAPHSTEGLSASVSPQSHWRDPSNATQDTQLAREGVKWPEMSSNTEWQQLDDDFNKILDISLVGQQSKNSTQ